LPDSNAKLLKIFQSIIIKMIALRLKWHKAKAMVRFLLDLGFIFVGGTSSKINLENLG
jgi:hypothetical protein